jgi:SAM-dependent methyltransferase
MRKLPERVFYSDRQKNTLDEASRILKAKKVLSVLDDYTSADLGTWRCLDVGSSGGIISRFLGKAFRQVIGVDVDVKAISFAQQHNDRANVTFIQGDGCKLPFMDGQLDLVICNHVYEHVPDARLLFDEIYRVLRPGGVCYLACTNKYWILEPHHNLPFLSWLPRSLSNIYLRLSGRGQGYEEQLRSRTQILKLVHRFQVADYTLRIVRTPRQFYATDVIRGWAIVQHIPVRVARLLLFWMPNFVFVLRKGVVAELRGLNCLER